MKNILFLLIVFLFFVNFIMLDNQQDHTSKGAQLINSLLTKTARLMSEKYDLKPCGIGSAMPGGPIQEVTLCFDTKYSLTKQQLRKFLINTAEELMNQVNKDPEIQKFLKERPFTIKNVEIIIYNNDSNGLEVFDPTICVARISQGTLIYRTNDANDPFKYKNTYRECYEEASKAITDKFES